MAGRGWLKGRASKFAREMHETTTPLWVSEWVNEVEKDVVEDNKDEKRRKSGEQSRLQSHFQFLKIHFPSSETLSTTDPTLTSSHHPFFYFLVFLPLSYQFCCHRTGSRISIWCYDLLLIGHRCSFHLVFPPNGTHFHTPWLSQTAASGGLVSVCQPCRTTSLLMTSPTKTTTFISRCSAPLSPRLFYLHSSRPCTKQHAVKRPDIWSTTSFQYGPLSPLWCINKLQNIIN